MILPASQTHKSIIQSTSKQTIKHWFTPPVPNLGSVLGSGRGMPNKTLKNQHSLLVENLSFFSKA